MINSKDKKLLILAGVCVSIIVLFWAFCYFPASRKLRLLKAELNSIKGEIAAIESHHADGTKDIKGLVESLQKAFDDAVVKLPAKEEQTLRFLSSEANRLGLEVVSTRPAAKRPFLDANNNPIVLEGSKCFEMPIAMEMLGLYKSIGEYLKVLRETSPALIRVEDIKIQKVQAQSPRLKVNLELRLYLLCPE